MNKELHRYVLHLPCLPALLASVRILHLVTLVGGMMIWNVAISAVILRVLQLWTRLCHNRRRGSRGNRILCASGDKDSRNAVLSLAVQTLVVSYWTLWEWHRRRTYQRKSFCNLWPQYYTHHQGECSAVNKTYTLAQKLEVLKYVCSHSEAKAAHHIVTQFRTFSLLNIFVVGSNHEMSRTKYLNNVH